MDYEQAASEQFAEYEQGPAAAYEEVPEYEAAATFAAEQEHEAACQVEALEQEQGELHEKIADPDFYKAEGGDAITAVNTRLEEIEAILGERYERWETLEAIAETS